MNKNILLSVGCLFVLFLSSPAQAQPEIAEPLRAAIRADEDGIEVLRGDNTVPVLTQHAQQDFRPYIHPIVAPDGNGQLTQYSPDHHRHQTGLYWGFTRVNGRDYFHHPDGDYWRRVSLDLIRAEATIDNPTVAWRTVYDLLDEDGNPILRETQQWTLRQEGGVFLLDLVWSGEAQVDVTIGKYDYGGLFLRMPWKEGIDAHIVNSARQVNERAEGKRALWLDVGMDIEGRDDQGHITILDHPDNPDFPQPWRVDGQFGVGPVRARLHDWKIDANNTTQFRHRFLVHTGEFRDVWVSEQWSRFTGLGGNWAQWGIAQMEGRQAKFQTPEEAVADATVTEGFEVNAYAAEPMITQPMAFCWDDRGRMWIAENRDYESRGSGFSGAGDSRILILEDTDHDGVADSRKVFLEGIPFPAAIAVGFDGLWLGAPPNLLYVPDRDGDDKADVEDIEVRLTGWGIRDRHETLNSFHWGPDGWLYGLQGFATPSQVGKPVDGGRLYRHGEPFPERFEFAEEPVDINGGVWRYHPIKDRFEVVAHGFSNPWGVDYDAKGQLFITACVIPHLWHVIPGGIYHRQGGSHFNPHVYSDIRTITDHAHRSAHGGARIYQSDAYPEKYQGQIFMANIHEHAVLVDILERRGSGFVGKHGEDFMLANNAQWIGFSVEIGPEGGVYVLDWHDADICGKEVLNHETGRVFRIMPKESNATDFAGRYGDLRELSDLELAQLQHSRSDWHARRARVILHNRATKREIDADALASLRTTYQSDANADDRLRGLWALHLVDAISSEELTEALDDRDEYVRAWAIQLLCEDETPSESALSRFQTLAAQDESPVVRLYLAAAIQRLDQDQVLPLVAALSKRGEDASDHNIPKMLWFGLEPLVTDNPDQVLKLASQAKIPLLTRFVARRLTSAGRMDIVVAQVSSAADPARRDFLLGMRDGLEGRFDVEEPNGWSELYASIQNERSESGRLAQQLARIFGDAEAIESMMSILKDNDAPAEERINALEGLAGRQHPELLGMLLSLIDDPTLQINAIRATASFDDPGLGKGLLARYTDLSEEARSEVVHAMSSRSGSGRQLTDAIDSGIVPRRDVPAYVARLLRRVVGNGFLEVWGAIDAVDTDHEAQFERYRALLTPTALGNADVTNGRKLFDRTCLACHKLFDEGGEIGPDITGANRSNLEYLLGNILTPSAVIQDDYRMQIILTDEGRVYSGIPTEEDERQLKLLIANEPDPVVIAKASIESREIAPVSMMPAGLLANLNEEEVLDLIKYLQSSAQVEKPEEE